MEMLDSCPEICEEKCEVTIVRKNNDYSTLLLEYKDCQYLAVLCSELDDVSDGEDEMPSPPALKRCRNDDL